MSNMRSRIAEVVTFFGSERKEDTRRRMRGELPLKNGSPYPATDRIMVIVYEELLSEYGFGKRPDSLSSMIEDEAGDAPDNEGPSELDIAFYDATRKVNEAIRGISRAFAEDRKVLTFNMETFRAEARLRKESSEEEAGDE